MKLKPLFATYLIGPLHILVFPPFIDKNEDRKKLAVGKLNSATLNRDVKYQMRLNLNKLQLLIKCVKGMIFILNTNPTSLSFYESWSFNMVLEPGFIGGRGFEPPPHLLI